VLLDWSCRESFHIFDYLAKQTVPRSEYEILWIEYYDRKAEPIDRHIKEAESAGDAPPVDQWVALDIPRDVYFHKHLMYNAGIVLSRGDIVIVCDSDAMVRETFLESILTAFAQEPGIVLQLDEFRNERRDLYPFRSPSFETVLGEGCINNAGGKTTGVLDRVDPLHSRNYGACMAAKRDDLIRIGGADEHIDYLGHICGPYDMTFRLVNDGKREVWHPSEFLYHVWHPGQGGEKNYLGPHDGKHMSTTALSARSSGRSEPLRENNAIARLRSGANTEDREQLLDLLVSSEVVKSWSRDEVEKHQSSVWKNLVPGSSVASGKVSTTLIKMVAKQFWIKLVKVPRQIRSPAAALRKAINAFHFVRNSVQHNVYIAEQSQRIFQDLAAQGTTEVALYGTGDIAEMLCKLSAGLQVTIRSVYDDFADDDFAGFKVQPTRELVNRSEKVIIASIVGVEEKIEHLQQLGVERERIVNLQ